jgi:hypothetical protein
MLNWTPFINGYWFDYGGLLDHQTSSKQAAFNGSLSYGAPFLKKTTCLASLLYVPVLIPKTVFTLRRYSVLLFPFGHVFGTGTYWRLPQIS